MQEDRNGWLIGWVCFVGFVTWLDWQRLFIVLLAPNPPWLIQNLYFLSVIVLLGLFVAVLGLGHLSRLQRGVLAFCIIWLLAEPFIVWAPEKALMRDAARIHVGMTMAEAEAIMADYSGGTTQFERANGIGDLVYCADDVCDTTAHFNFVDGQIVRVWLDTD